MLTAPALLMGAPVANAAETAVYVEGTELQVWAEGASTNNNIRITFVWEGMTPKYQVTDSGSTLVPNSDKGCEGVNAHTVRCTFAVKSFAIRTYGGNDKITIKPKVPTWVNAGAGHDSINLSSRNDVAYGGPGNDTFWGWSGNDRFYGEDGTDTLYGHKGNDRLHGGPGRDYVYGGEGHDYADGEQDGDWVYGENGNDTLYGSSGGDYMHGGPGNDTVDGGNNNDSVIGGSGNDKIYGANGNDRVYGKDGKAANDHLWGNKGDDYCEADPRDVKNTCES